MSDNPLDNLSLPAQPARDNEGLLETIAAIRRRLADPEGIYKNRPDLVAEAEARLRSALIRANATEKVETPEARAERQHSEAFANKPPAGLTELMDSRLAQIEALGEREVARMTGELRQQLGRTDYDALLEQAGAAAPGKPLQKAVGADLHLLRLYASRGRFNQARERTRPGKR